MEETGIASIWLGVADSDETLGQFFEFVYNEDGDSSSPFTRSFDTDWIDEDFLVAERIESTARISTALQGIPDGEQIIPQVEAIVGAELAKVINAIVILYDFKYDGRVKQAAGQGVQLNFIGTANCRD